MDDSKYIKASDRSHCLGLPPTDCLNNCMHGPCDCSGEWRGNCKNYYSHAVVDDIARELYESLKYAVKNIHLPEKGYGDNGPTEEFEYALAALYRYEQVMG